MSVLSIFAPLTRAPSFSAFAVSHLPPIRQMELFPQVIRFYLGAADRQYPAQQRSYQISEDTQAVCKKALGALLSLLCVGNFPFSPCSFFSS